MAPVIRKPLQQPDVAVIFAQDAPLPPVRLRGVEAGKRVLEAKNGTMTVGEVAAVLGSTHQAVEVAIGRVDRARRALEIEATRQSKPQPSPMWLDAGLATVSHDAFDMR